jgi:hypothetical protein
VALLAGPLRHARTSRTLGLLQGLRPIPRLHQTTCLSHQPRGSGTAGTMRDGSRVHREPIDQLGTQLCPGSIANGYAADFHRGLPTGTLNRLRSRPSPLDSRALHPGPYLPDLSRCHAYGAFNTGSSRIPSDLARRTRPVWRYQAVPALSALLPALPGVSRIGLRSAPTKLLRQPGGKDLHLP